jgi:ribosome biogenesis protein BRX1
MLTVPFQHLPLACFVGSFQIRALEKRQKAGKYAKKVKAKVRRKMHEMENTLEPDEFAELWKGE